MPYVSRLLRDRPAAVSLLVAFLLLSAGGAARAGAFKNSAHGNSSLLPRGCGTCHVGHGRPLTTMQSKDTASQACLRCHSDAAAQTEARQKGLLAGSPELKKVGAEFQKTSRHTLDGTGANALTCVSCHDMHYGVKAPDGAPDLTRPKEIGNARKPAEAEYKRCYRCHGNAQGAVPDLENIERLMKAGNPSYHPVSQVGRNTNMLSLAAPYTAQSIIACTSCHGSDRATGPEGPHGSVYKPILKASYTKDAGKSESAFEYALCYRCHSRSVILGEQAWKYHKKHLEKNASCFTCHNSHGSVQYTHLIDFDTKVVFANSKGQLNFKDNGVRTGECNLLCHHKDHDGEDY